MQHRQKKIATHIESFKTTRLNIEEGKTYIKLAKQKNFWISFILTFRLSFQDFVSILNLEDSEQSRIDIETLAQNMGKKYNIAVKYVFSTYLPNESKKQKAQKYLEEIKKAKKTQETEEYRRLLDILSDKKYIQLIASKKSFSQLSEEEIRIIIQHRLKYALSLASIPYSRQLLSYHVPEDLKEEYALLSERNNQFYQFNNRYNNFDSFNKFSRR